MGRHADISSSSVFAGRPPALVVGAAAVAVLLVGSLVWWVAAGGGDEDGCEEQQAVQVTVAPEIAGVARDLFAGAGSLEQRCIAAEVAAQGPLQTLANLAALDETALPDVWVPDSSLWRARAAETELETAGSLATSPVVLVSNQEAIDAVGWQESPPTWSEVLAAGRPLAVPDLNANVAALSAMASVVESLGGGEEANAAVVQVALTAARGTIPAPAEAIAAAVEGGADAPLGALSEQEVLETNADAGRTALVAVYPADGSPSLDYPVLRVGRPGEEQRAAVDAVVEVLTSDVAVERAREAGFRGPDGAPPLGELPGVREQVPTELELDPMAVQELLSRLSALAVPSRLLTVIDVSTSMEAAVGDGNRATLARDATKSALALLPDTAAAGLWIFAYEVDGGRDWEELVPVGTLASDAGGVPRRQALAAQLDTVPGRLTPGGTGLYDTTLAAVRAAREDYDPDFVNTVVLLTDGTDDDDAEGIALDELLATLQAEEDPDRPVQVVAIGIGPEADLDALERITQATGGRAYSAVEETDLQQVLFDALGRRGQPSGG